MFNMLSGKPLTSRFERRVVLAVVAHDSAAHRDRVRSVVVKGNDSLEPPVRGKRDLLDAHFGVLQQLVAALFQRFASFVKPDRFVERNRAFFELIDDLFEFRERRFERHCRDFRPHLGHGAPF
jgi:hypothetical protein